MQKIKACGFLVVRGKPIESFLLMIHPTRYDLPKGHVDPGESEIQCALRELDEETGIGAEDLDIDPDFRFVLSYQVRPRKFNFETCDKTLVVFLGYLKRDAEICVSEHESFEWRTWNPPHQIQKETIDPLLAHLADFLDRKRVG